MLPQILILAFDLGRERADQTSSVLYVTRASDAPRLECSPCLAPAKSVRVCPHRQSRYVKLIAARFAALAVLFTL